MRLPGSTLAHLAARRLAALSGVALLRLLFTALAGGLALSLTLSSCAHLPQAAKATSVLLQLAQAAAQLSDSARRASEADEQRAHEILRKQLPAALDAVDVALQGVCLHELPEHARMCEHYRAYKRGHAAVCRPPAVR